MIDKINIANERLTRAKLSLAGLSIGDRDTTCAIVGGIVALSAGQKSISTDWLCSREALPNWPFKDV